ncbi:hypothetical protein PILCRDRAFT_813856 [Piloderma croceum F 1598]|uniref:Uncharacterized protein n=1 Tax=Piloderma croceum (strain F 1598) TaxID=765440 RepID=A0A0C3FX86_PILCF|nr:hypothetical protein PILCRDRAFT_813856 [Piloderma croceum F 1598]
MFGLTFFYYIILSIVLWTTIVNANTEIRNFEVTEQQEIIIPQISKWPTLFPGKNEGEMALQMAPAETSLDNMSPNAAVWNPKSYPHEIWVVLDLDHEEWKKYSKFTLRLSWPASLPASFFMQIYTPESLFGELPKSLQTSITEINKDTPEARITRRMFAHIRVVDETGGISATTAPQHVTFRVILEPLIMGVLPASVQPTVLAIVLVASLAALAVPWINRYLERLARNAMEETTKAKAE